MSDLLQLGDVFKLPMKTKVLAKVKDCYVFDDYFDTQSESFHQISIGTEYHQSINEHTVLIDVKDFLKKKFKISFDLINDEEFLETLDAYKQDTTLLLGCKDNFLVTGVEMTGGSKRENYPDGYYVTASRLLINGQYNEKSTVIKFYQTGCFSDIVENIKPLRKMTQTLVWG